MTWDPITWLGRLANGFKAWLKDVNRESFQAFVTQCVWIYGSVRFTNVACALMLDEGPKSESHYGWGFQIVLTLVSAWGFKTAVGAVDSQNKRKTNVPYVESKERGQVAGAAAAVVIAGKAADVKAARMTAEYPAQPPVSPVTVQNAQVVTAPGASPEPPPDEQTWATGPDPRAGIL